MTTTGDNSEVYLDHAASAPMVPEAIEAMVEALGRFHANPSGAHKASRAAQRAIDESRESLAEVLGCGPGDVVFTSGGTEADNLAFANCPQGDGVAVVSAIEHPAVLEPARRVGAVEVGVGLSGVVDLPALASSLSAHTMFVSVMAANNEVGTVQPIDEIAELVREKSPQALLHTDAVQAFRWVDPRHYVPHCDMVSFSAHKFGGPTGVGALVVAQDLTLTPHLLGGGQERGRRSGTSNTAGIVAMCVAARLAQDRRERQRTSVGALRDRLIDGLVALPGVVETVSASVDRRPEVLPSFAHVCVEGVDSEALIFLLDRAGIRASAASSCASGAQSSSHVLAAMGLADPLLRGAIRLTLGPEVTTEQVCSTVEVFAAAVDQLRGAGG